MTEERFNEIKANIKANFNLQDEYLEELDPGEAQVLEFQSPQGLIKLCFITKPKLLDKKTSYSNRVGSGVKVDYVYSDEESVSYLEAYIFSEADNDWKKIEAETLF